MKVVATLIVAAAGLAGCAVVPAGRPVVYGPPVMMAPAPQPYVTVMPPPVVVVPARPYYGYGGGYGYGRGRGHWR
jgi:hypothetical protein